MFCAFEENCEYNIIYADYNIGIDLKDLEKYSLNIFYDFRQVFKINSNNLFPENITEIAVKVKMEVFSGIVLIEAYQNGYRMSNQENIFPGKSTWLTFKFKKY